MDVHYNLIIRKLYISTRYFMFFVFVSTLNFFCSYWVSLKPTSSLTLSTVTHSLTSSLLRSIKSTSYCWLVQLRWSGDIGCSGARQISHGVPLRHQGPHQQGQALRRRFAGARPLDLVVYIRRNALHVWIFFFFE